jgi:hypothetical protein
VSRPSEYSQETADAICERLINGESLRTICKDEDMPAISTVFRWLSLDKAFSEQYARARDEQADTIADEILAIADGAEDAQKARLQVDVRKWYAGKLRPKKYGEKVTQEVSGPDGGPILTTTRIERVVVDPANPDR